LALLSARLADAGRLFVGTFSLSQLALNTSKAVIKDIFIPFILFLLVNSENDRFRTCNIIFSLDNKEFL
jgi:hypothetical protein